MVSATPSSSPFSPVPVQSPSCRIQSFTHCSSVGASPQATCGTTTRKHNPVGAPLWGLQPCPGCIHLCCDVFRLPHGDLLWHGPPQAAGGHPASPWSSLWAAEESAQVPGGPPPCASSLQTLLSVGLFLSHFFSVPSLRAAAQWHTSGCICSLWEEHLHPTRQVVL